MDALDYLTCLSDDMHGFVQNLLQPQSESGLSQGLEKVPFHRCTASFRRPLAKGRPTIHIQQTLEQRAVASAASSSGRDHYLLALLSSEPQVHTRSPGPSLGGPESFPSNFPK